MDKWEKYRLFIGKKADYYIPRFRKFEETGGALSWNWAAFFLGIMWMLYRKMYLYSLLVFAISGFIGIVIALVSPQNIFLAIGVQLWIMVGFGAFGNYLYYIFVKKQIEHLKQLYPDSESLKIILNHHGGTNIVAPILYLLIIFILQMMTIRPQ